MTVHRAVLLEETVSLLVGGSSSFEPSRWVDCTLGGGSHAAALLEAVPEGELLGLDRDPESLRRTEEQLSGYRPRFEAQLSDYRDLRRVIEKKTGRDASPVSSPTWASPATSSTILSEVSPSARTARWTCGSTARAAGRRRRSFYGLSPKPSSPRSCAATATSPAPVVSPRASVDAGGRRR